MDSTIGNRDKQVAKEMSYGQQIEAMKQKQFEESQGRLQGQIAPLNKQKASAQKRGKEYIDRLNASLATAVNQTETKTGADLRALASSKNTTDAQRQRMFANLGTLDSGGSMGFTGRQENADTEFSNNQANLMQGKQDSIQALQLEAQDKKATAESAVESEIASFDNVISQINTIYANNESARQVATAEAYKGLQDRVYAINNEFNKNMMELERQANDVDLKQAEASSNGGKNMTNEMKIKNEFDSELKNMNYFEVKNSYDRMINADVNDSAGQFNIIYNFVKLLDPATGVKEGEFQNTVNAQSLLNKARGLVGNWKEGQTVSPQTAQKFKDEIKNIAGPTFEKYDRTKQLYSNYSSNFGLGSDLIQGIGSNNQNSGNTLMIDGYKVEVY